ncbi:NitT/TauT family transport system substrate-binding protein [Neorhizobium sp. 2083]|uniref:ABC transporter substrate-binding protein n=1 Tax=Neorhizobium sp. 2083 TaxID=2817762 RepID=UPI002863C965|nr:ABC transporter substrate-binding protein [Neorhizobium sp. 2083]MDR6817488.1 NitT/TauT family transport system substrate-binding protein [Neorhizobium sp. 2083]
MRNLVKAALAATALFSMWAGGAVAQTRVSIGCTATTDCASAAVALQEGIFKKNGLDVTMTLIGINSTIPAALLSNSLQIGGPTPPTFLQAVDGGLELVAVAGASATAPSTVDTVAVVATAASGINGPKDFVGKKVGSPGIGAFLQVLFSKWLITNGVDPKKVNFVEVGFPTMNDALKSNAVDAVITAEPIMSRILASGTGKAVGYFLDKLPERRPQILYASTKTWADANPAALKAFRASIEEGAKIANENPEKGRKAISDFTKIPMDVLSKQKLTTADAKIDKEQLDWWVSTMNEQNMLQGKLDTAALIQK